MSWLFCQLDAANHRIPPIIDFMEKSSSTTAVLVFSPLNALRREQVIKLREIGMKACILKGDRVALDGEDAEEEVVHVSLNTAEPLESLKDFHLILTFVTQRLWLKTSESLKSLKRPSLSVAAKPLSWMGHILSLTGKLKIMCDIKCDLL